MKSILFTLGTVFIGLFSLSFILNESDKNKVPRSLDDSFSLVTAGEVIIEDQKLKVGEFYMAKTEVSNAEYREFLASMKNKLSAADFEKLRVDSSNWISQLSDNMTSFAEYYHSHDAYDDYPVLNVRHEVAIAYCKWLTTSTNKSLEESGEELRVEYRLPTREEWVKAARGGQEKALYAWGGPYLQNKKGTKLSNFDNLGSENIHFNQETGEYEIVKLPVYIGTPGNLNENAIITAPVISYSANDIGLYNMNGNAAEMLNDKNIAVGGSWNSPGYDIRNESIMTYETSSIMVGFRPVVELVQ